MATSNKTGTLYDTQTSDSIRQLRMLKSMMDQGAISAGDYNSNVGSLLGGNQKQRAIDEARQKTLEDQQRNLGIAQQYGQLGDAYTSKTYLKNSLPEDIRSKIKPSRTPSIWERIIAADKTKKWYDGIPIAWMFDNPFSRASQGYSNPYKMGVHFESENQNPLDYLLKSGMYGTSDLRPDGDISRLDDLYNYSYTNPTTD